MKSLRCEKPKTSEENQTMLSAVVISQTRGEPYSAGGNWGARAGCLRCRLTWDASCRPWSSCTGLCRPALGRAWHPPPPGRTPWWPSPATAARGLVSKPQDLASENRGRTVAQKQSEKTMIYNTVQITGNVLEDNTFLIFIRVILIWIMISAITYQLWLLE